MEKKEFSKFEIASIKRTAANMWPLLKKKRNLIAKIEELSKELEDVKAKLDSYDTPIKAFTNGWSVEYLVERVVGDNKVAKYQLKYPETVIPTDSTVNIDDIIEYSETELNSNVIGDSREHENLNH